VYMNILTLRFMRSVVGGPGGANHSVLCGGGEGCSYYARDVGVLRSCMPSSVVWCLVPASVVISLKACGE
jgi:hypothetical protein